MHKPLQIWNMDESGVSNDTQSESSRDGRMTRDNRMTTWHYPGLMCHSLDHYRLPKNTIDKQSY